MTELTTNEHSCKENDNYNHVVQYSWIGKQWFVDDGDFYHKIPINYCPFCGDKL